MRIYAKYSNENISHRSRLVRLFCVLQTHFYSIVNTFILHFTDICGIIKKSLVVLYGLYGVIEVNLCS